jgi:hypothetical protein
MSAAPENIRHRYHTASVVSLSAFYKEPAVPIHVFTNRDNVLTALFDSNQLVKMPTLTDIRDYHFVFNALVPNTFPTHLLLCPSNAIGEAPLLHMCQIAPILTHGRIDVGSGSTVLPQNLRPLQATDPIAISVSRLPTFGHKLVLEIHAGLPPLSVLASDVDKNLREAETVHFGLHPIVAFAPSTITFTPEDDRLEQSFRILPRRSGNAYPSP